MEKRFKLFHEIIISLGETGVLADIVLIGSWCLYLYRDIFRDADTMPAVRTVDLDFLVPNPPKIKHKVDISKMLETLNFVEEFSHLSGNSKFIHPDLEVEFIIPEKGRGKDGPHIIKEINVRAQGLRYVDLLQDHTIIIPYNNFPVRVPEPSAFILHKLQLSGRRGKKVKKVKDLETAKGLGEYLATREDQVEKMKEIYRNLPSKWKREILEVAKEQSEIIYRILYEK
ncbi:MAG TPA: GSU2403 family nucleotidyltransferase fold protein [Spirochaetota bacterium]|nr:GSU2403 family nucleotidyltransferase fold protein [Spirochaetota bacterium]HPV42791.1 GSU2403 family nucleotidyltransferase fold protein [Spirochaetota bacterium]